jgi:predicted transcriptional regulator
VDVMYETKQRDHKIGLIEKGEIDPRQSSVQRLVTFYTERAKGLQRVYETSGGQKSWRATGMALAA